MPDTQLCAGRLEKDVIQKSNMHVDGKSDGREVPTKCSNKSGNPPAEGMEGRRPGKGNTEQTTASQTQSWGDALRGLRGVREAAKRDKRLQSTALLHHVSVALKLSIHSKRHYETTIQARVPLSPGTESARAVG